MFLLYILEVSAALFVLYILTLIVASFFVSTKKDYTHDNGFYRFLITSSAAIGLVIMRVRVEIRGKEKLSTDRKLLFVCNHLSKFDPIITWRYFYKHRIGFISKPSNFKVPFWGRLIRRCCFLPIDRESALKAIRTVNKAANLIKSQTVSIGVYPEGQRNYDKGLLPFHNGILKIAKKAECPVAIMAIRGTENIAKNYPFHSSKVFLDICEVIPAEKVCEMNSEELGAYCRDVIAKSLGI